MVPKILLVGKDNPEKQREGVEGLPLFYFFTVQLHLLWVCDCVCVCVCGGGGGEGGRE